MDSVPSTEVIKQGNKPSVFGILSQKRLRWLGHVHHTVDEWLPKAALHRDLATGRWVGCPPLCFKDNFKTDMKSANIHTDKKEAVVGNHNNWRNTIRIREKSWGGNGGRNKKREKFHHPTGDFITPSDFQCRH